jgi:hypothetical protein
MKTSNAPLMLCIAAILCILTLGCESKKEQSSPNKSPFQSIVIGDNAIVATLPEYNGWMTDDEAGQSRKTKPGESFILTAGSTLKIFDRHASYRVTAELSPRQGLIIESRFDARSFGDKVTTQSYFVAAEIKKANQTATPTKPTD